MYLFMAYLTPGYILPCSICTRDIPRKHIVIKRQDSVASLSVPSMSLSPFLLSDVQLIFEQKPEEEEVWAFSFSYLCSATKRRA